MLSPEDAARAEARLQHAVVEGGKDAEKLAFEHASRTETVTELELTSLRSPKWLHSAVISSYCLLLKDAFTQSYPLQMKRVKIWGSKFWEYLVGAKQ